MIIPRFPPSIANWSLTDEGVLLHDCDSTNGTFVNGDPVKEAWLHPGQTVHLGDVELFIESTEVNVAIPKFERRAPNRRWCLKAA